MGLPYDEVRHALIQSLQAYGYRRGENLHITIESAQNDVQQGMTLLEKAQLNKFDLFYTGGTVATIAAKNVLLGQQTPVVFASPTDPVGIGVIDGFKFPPKANFTGVCYPVPVKARLRFIRQLLPKARTFGLIFADMPQSHSYNRWLQALLQDDPEFKDIRILYRAVPLVLGEEGDLRMAQAAIPIIQALDNQVDAFIKPNDQLGSRRAFAQTVYEHAKKPLIGLVRQDVMQNWGASAVIYPSHTSIGQQAAFMIKRLLEGEVVANIIPQWPTQFGYAIDLPKTRQYHISVPVGLLQLAGDNVIK
ncbi:ABC transporter substrate-binding protein [Magnetococcus marinus]|uniref:ABC transporter substrate-binding protein n=1 Tax=Magnetococcus marinus TaxID=1124597 RepID=UPI0005A05C07|nr:ABC transporter substrate binding protein [Magnetococcus marinus]